MEKSDIMEDNMSDKHIDNNSMENDVQVVKTPPESTMNVIKVEGEESYLYLMELPEQGS